jgi:hypothetical protein
MENDGTASAPIDVPVPSSMVTNTFDAYPRLGSNVTSDGMSLSYSATNVDGRLWAIVVASQLGICTSVRDIKFLVGSFCHLWNTPITAGPQTLIFEGCNLEGGLSYNAIVYVEDAFGADDGIMSPPVPFTVPHSNEFIGNPIAVPRTSSPQGVIIQYSPKETGTSWTMLVSTPHAAWVDPPAMKAGTYSVGGPACKEQGKVLPGDGVTMQAHLTGCSLVRGLQYKAFTYVEGANTSYSDGTLSQPIDVPVQAVSFAFQSGPELTSTPTSDLINLKFTGEATDEGPNAATNGTLWAMVTTVLNAPFVTAASMKAATSALGTSDCRVMGQPIVALTQVDLNLTGCLLQHATAYRTAVYVEDTLDRNDGSLTFVDTDIPPGLSNAFILYPEIIGNATTDNVTVQFTASAPFGKTWITVIPSGLAAQATPASIMSAINAKQYKSCDEQGSTITGSISSFDLSGCNLAHQSTEQAHVTNYAVMVYVADEGGHSDGVVAAAHFTTPPSNVFTTAPHVHGTPAPAGATIRLTAASTGKVWVIITLASHASSVTIATMKTPGTYALGTTSCRIIGSGILAGQVKLGALGLCVGSCNHLQGVRLH